MLVDGSVVACGSTVPLVEACDDDAVVNSSLTPGGY